MNTLDAFALYERAQEDVIAKNTMRNYRSSITALEAAGVTTTTEITRARVGAWLARLKEQDLTVATINGHLNAVLSLTNWLERQGRFPMRRILRLRRLKIRMAPPPPPVFLSHEELARLRTEARLVNPDLDLAIAFAVFTGLRLDELRRLHREDLSLDGDTPFLRVLRTRGETKTRRSRTVPMAVAFAREIKARELAPGPIFTPTLSNCQATYVHYENLKRWMRLARDRAGLYHVTWLTLRHTFASWLRQGGVELSLVSGWMGNTVRICEMFYAAMGPGGDKRIERGFTDVA